MTSTVVIGYDGSPASGRALLEAAREAAWRGVPLTVAYAYHWPAADTPMSVSPRSVEEACREAAEGIVAEGAAIAHARHPDLEITARPAPGFAPDVLTKAARGAELLVLGDRGRGGFAELMLGSVSLRTLAYAECPTMVVRGGPDGARDLVVAAVELDRSRDDVLRFAFAEAAARAVPLEIVHVAEPAWGAEDILGAEEARAAAEYTADRLEHRLADCVEPWQADHPDVAVRHRVVAGSPGAVLTTASRAADLVVVGAIRRRDRRRGLRLGPVAHTLLHHADCPVVVVPFT